MIDETIPAPLNPAEFTTDALRPMHLGEILDRTLQIYRRKFLLFAGIAAGPSVVVLACFAAAFGMIYFARNGDTTANMLVGLGVFALFAIGTPLYIVSGAFGFAALSSAAKKRFFGESVTISAMYREAWPNGWRYIGLYTLEGLILVVIPGVVAFFLILGYGILMRLTGTPSASAGVAAFLMIFLIFALIAVYVLWMLPRLCLSFAASVVEKAAVVESLKRAWILSRGTRWRILLLFLLGLICSWMLNLLVTIPMMIITSLVPGMKSPQNAQTLGSIMIFVTYGAGFVVQALIRPVYGIALVLFYYDQRIRHEGYDIEWMMERAGLTTIAAPPVMQPLPTPEILPGAQA